MALTSVGGHLQRAAHVCTTEFRLTVRAFGLDHGTSRPLSSAGRAARLIRFDHWWWSKLPPLMAVVYLALLTHPDGGSSVAALIAGFVITIFLIAAYGHVFNDVFDIRIDRLAGKPNAMATVSPATRAMLCAALAAAAFVPSVFLEFPVSARLLILLNLLLPTIYSMPPVRLKERGVLGILSDAAGSHITPTLMALAVFSSPGQDAVIWLTLTLWATALGVKGILHHQLQDFTADVDAGVHTYVTDQRFAAVSRFMPLYNLAIELPLSTALVVAAFAYGVLPALSLVVYCAVETIKYRRGFQFALSADSRTLRSSIPFTNELFYAAYLPLAAVIQLSLVSPGLLWLVAMHIVTLNQQLRLAARDLVAVIRLVIPSQGHRLQRYVRSRLV